MTKYILYCAQEANFQTRSMLIPLDLIMKCEERVRDLQILRNYIIRNAIFEHQGQEYVVDQLLINDIIWDGNRGTYQPSPVSNIIADFTRYADGMDEDCLCQLYDQEWANNIICNVVTGFNHVLNYCNFRNKTEYQGKPIEIVEGFLVLESDDGKLRMPPVDTVKELFAVYYQ